MFSFKKKKAEPKIYAAGPVIHSSSGKTRPFVAPVLNGGSFIITDPKDETGFFQAYKRYSSMSPMDRRAEYASNNWRKMHGYPLRRGGCNKRHKEMSKYSEEKRWFEYFERAERNGHPISIVRIDGNPEEKGSEKEV